MIIDLNVGVTRQTVVDRLKEHENHVKHRALLRFKEFMEKPLPKEVYEKCLAYEGEFDIMHDWKAESYEEFADMVVYEAMIECQTLARRL